jgi:DinB family protein
MSVFTNPASRSREDAAAYTNAVLDLLGDAAPLEVLAQTHAKLRKLVEPLTAPQLATPETPGKWSIGHVLRHLADSEIVWGVRLRMVLAHDRPAIAGYDQDRWADRLHYDAADPAESLREFGVVRHGNLRLLQRASPAELARVGVHAERGEESVQHMIKLYAGHDLLHLRQIERILHAISAS